MNVCFGVFAHVDAGKTTFSERLLYLTHATRTLGRVDDATASLDADPIERARGVTVFSGQSRFERGGDVFYLLDTPGHADFAPEAERAMLALDAAVLLVDGCAPVKPHAAALYRLAKRAKLPVAVFVNKADLPGYDARRALAGIRARLCPNAVPFEGGKPDMESAAELDDALLEAYLEGRASEEDALSATRRAFLAGEAVPVFFGSAATGEGVEAFLDGFRSLARTEYDPNAPFSAVAYQVRRDKRGERVTFLKITSGTLRPRDAFRFGDEEEKAHELRAYRGERYELLEAARAGELAGVTGLSAPRAGDTLTRDGIAERKAVFQMTPVMRARVRSEDGARDADVLAKLKLLEEEEPMLRAAFDARLRCNFVCVMGEMQTQVVEALMKNRFGMSVTLCEPVMRYLETIAAPVVGCGHYEPLRHYAEVRLLLEPNPRGAGITFESRCHVDDLARAYQRLICTHVFEKTHLGYLTGSPLTDVNVVLLAGRAHLKHTEGGDFREAVYRAIRQGLEKAEKLLLEPYCRFEADVPAEFSGRVRVELVRRDAEIADERVEAGRAVFSGRAAASRLQGYPLELASLTRGDGGLQLLPDGYEPCADAARVIEEIGYDADADLENSSASIFCAKGAGFLVKGCEAEAYMHCPPV